VDDGNNPFREGQDVRFELPAGLRAAAAARPVPADVSVAFVGTVAVSDEQIDVLSTKLSSMEVLE
jgi:hypothetical protein